jgi:hypothetical protein
VKQKRRRAGDAPDRIDRFPPGPYCAGDIMGFGVMAGAGGGFFAAAAAAASLRRCITLR